ncbi:TonB-dependent receptor [Maribellus maritimus]|uniref:TonB-dependent receptor n=1 Tax=Maribellus maritimus TaxID=2870838 RepID=UPI001EEA716B|nr:TonB-dependent receptor [Maribellus maritimus]MCG6187193.1 TonB-dependent receptor [Maribellus maritimus]
MKKIILSIVIYSLFTAFAQAQNLRVITDTTNTPDILIDEITVKSPKELPLVREIPTSISLLPARKLENDEIHSLTDISSKVPNFFMLDYGSKLQSSVFVRGIGSRLGSPSVGLYVDNVPYFEKTTFGFDFFDIERVEVLRGPQGTLYGRNTMGGIINVFSKSPLVYDETNISVTAGTHGYYNVNVNHYNRVDDKFGYSISGNYLNQNGYFTNNFSGDPADDKYSASGRARLVWRISDNLMLENTANYEKSEQYGFPYALYNDSTNRAVGISYDQESSYKRDLFSDGLVLKYQNDVFQFVSTSSYQFYDGLMAVDQDFTKNKIYFFEIGDRQNMVSQELMLKSLSPSKYKWLFGAYGFYQTMKQQTQGDIYTSKVNQDIRSDFNISGYALFHQSTFDDFLVENLSLTAGIRFDVEKDDLDYTFDQAVGDNPVSNLATEDYSENFTEILPKVALKYAFNNSLNTYATVSKGYKSGGFNTNTSIVLEEDRSFDSEKSWNYELGLKSSLAGNRLFVDAALFYIDWQDQQIDVPVPGGRGNMKKNAGESVSKGAELFVKGLLADNLEATLGYGYTHATFADYVVSEELNYNDNFIPYVPRHTINASLYKTFEFKNGFLEKLIANLSYKGVGKHYWSLDNSVYQDYYGLLDAKLSFVTGKFRFEIWGKNIFDTSYNTYYFEISSLHNSYVQMGKPASLGVNLKVAF